ncbi:MAG: class I SAM-dependent RNA methyltransferase [Verrucomicrobia bacterium]|nr:class I SAM-dependent RNA methyltransferase [Verrucomicrobiota bacterium]
MIIEDLTSSGEGVGSIEGKKVFVDGALPKEEVEVEVTENRKRFAKAKLLRIVRASPDRVDPICPLFGTCGGCQIMHLSYAEQLKWKRKRVQDALKRIGGLEIAVDECIPSPDQLGYRNKIHLHQGGLHKRHSHEVVPVERCYIFNGTLEPAKNAHEAIIRTAQEELLVEIDGVSNRPFIIEQLGALKFKIGPRDFFQVNPKQAFQLFQRAVQVAESGAMLDAYCGVGTLSLFAAQKGNKVLGIEVMESAVESARENAKLNGIENVAFKCGRVEKLLPKLGKFETIFLNPPRGGVEPEVIAALLQSPPKRLIYISCDPATLARDLKALQPHFVIESVTPFDMFPQTIHVETLVNLCYNYSL